MSLLGAQQYTTVAAAAAMKTQDNSMQVQDTENSLKAHMQNDNGQYKSEIYKRAEGIIPQKAAEAELANRHVTNIESRKPNTRTRKQRQKVPDDEEIDMDKIVKDDTPRYAIK